MNAKKQKSASSSQGTETAASGLVTVGDLYRAIDWSKAPAPVLENKDFLKRFRLVLLDMALFGGKDAEGIEHRNAARAMLNNIGVWPQIVKYLTNR